MALLCTESFLLASFFIRLKYFLAKSSSPSFKAISPKDNIEYKQYPEILRKFGDMEWIQICATNELVMINGLLVVEFKEITSFHFSVPDGWMNEYYELVDNGFVEIDSFIFHHER